MQIVNAYLKLFDNLNICLKISIQITLIFLFTFCLSELIKYSLFILFKYLAKKKSGIDSGIIIAAKKPILFILWLYSFVVCIDLIAERIDENFLKITLMLKLIIIYVSVLVFLLRSISQIKKRYIIKKERYGSIVDYGGLDSAEKLTKVVIFIVWLILVLGRMGFNLNALLAFGGAGGVIVGFAGKDLFANIFGGLIIYLDKPFAVGDWIASPDKEIEGDVEYIGWRQTRILTLEKYPIYVPNSIFGTIVIQNKSRLRSRRIKETMNIRYLDLNKIEKITKDITTMLKEHPGINKKYKMFVNFTNFTDGMLTLTIYTFTNTTEFVRFYEIKQDVLLRITNIIKDNGAELAFPTNTVYFEKDNDFDKVNIINDLKE